MSEKLPNSTDKKGGIPGLLSDIGRYGILGVLNRRRARSANTTKKAPNIPVAETEDDAEKVLDIPEADAVLQAIEQYQSDGIKSVDLTFIRSVENAQVSLESEKDFAHGLDGKLMTYDEKGAVIRIKTGQIMNNIDYYRRVLITCFDFGNIVSITVDESPDTDEKAGSGEWDFKNFDYAECVDIDDLCRKLKYLFESSSVEHFDLRLSKEFTCDAGYTPEDIEGIRTVATIIMGTIFTPEDEMSTNVKLRMWRPTDEDAFFEELKQMISLYFDGSETKVEVGQSTDFVKCNNFDHLKDQLTVLPADQRPEYINISFRSDDERALRYPKHVLATKLNGYLLTPDKNVTQGVVIKVNTVHLLEYTWDYMHILEPYFESGVNIGIQGAGPIETEKINGYTICPNNENLNLYCTNLLRDGAQCVELQIHCNHSDLNADEIRTFAEKLGIEVLNSAQSYIVNLKIRKEEFNNNILLLRFKLKLCPYFKKGIVGVRAG